MNNRIIDRIEARLGEKLSVTQNVGGGCIADSNIIESATGQRYFLKQGFSNGMFYYEANGLKEILKSGTIKAPKVIAVDDDFLLLELISQGAKSNEAMYKFGQAFAKMHQYTSSQYGFFEDNFIGSNPQVNSSSDSWVEFYFENRLLYQYKLAEQNGYATEELKKRFTKLESKLSSILAGSEEEPSLLHGDLWAGNYLIDSQGEAVLIDPAVYYGHREADLAMTKLFGGFSIAFYEGYQLEFPLKGGSEFRENIYLLYHVLNHLNLFGRGYYSQTIHLINYYL